MIVFFLAESEKSVTPLVEDMRRCGHVVVYYSSLEDLCVAISENAVEGRCLVVSDYRIFGIKSRCPYETMKGIMGELKCPFIFFNDPFPEASDLYDYWMGILQEYSSGLYDEAGMIHAINNLSKCIVGGKNQRDRESLNKRWTASELMEKFESGFKIPPSKKDLLVLLVENCGNLLDGNELCMKLWGSSEKRMSDRLHSYISWLRKNVLDRMSEPCTQILSDGNGAYLFRISDCPKVVLL